MNMKRSRPSLPRPKIEAGPQWNGYQNALWHRRDKKDVTILYSCIERWKSKFLQGYFERLGYRYKDLGDHVKEDVRWGKLYGNRMECNPMYFTSGALIRALFRLTEEQGLTKAEVVEKYVFLGGGGQCGPCRYGMYPQEYLKVVNEAGFEGFRILIFASDLITTEHKDAAFKINLAFRINMLVAIVLSDLLHVAECALRPRVKDKEELQRLLSEIEEELYQAFRKHTFALRLPVALRRASKRLQRLERDDAPLPLIFVTGEFFANLAHNDGNYSLRRFIMDEGAEVIPGLFTQRVMYDNWRRTREAISGLSQAQDKAERKHWARSLRRQKVSSAAVRGIYYALRWALDPKSFGGRADLHDLDELADVGRDYYHPEIFGGEGNLEISETIRHADVVDGVISCKPFGCMPSSGVSDGVQAKVLAENPHLDFLSIETSGDNEASILGRVSMLVFKAQQKVAGARGRRVWQPRRAPKRGVRWPWRRKPASAPNPVPAALRHTA